MEKIHNFYYDVETKLIYPNRIEAVKNLPNSRFYFYDKEFIQVDWTTEPSQSLDELYLKRAQQLRQDYEYLILCYSGGSDSTNILETFYYNNIHLDEIFVTGAFSKDSHSGDDANHNGEIYNNVYPTLKKLELKNTKITITDYTEYYNNLNNFKLIKNYQSDWVYNVGTYFSITHWYWYDLKNFIGKNNDKKTAVIFGADKPFIEYDLINEKYYATMKDTCFTHYGNFQKEENFQRVNFYNSPETIDLMRKQFHVVKKFLETKNKKEQEYIQINYENIIPKVIYNIKNKLVFRSPKSQSKLLSLRDTYLMKYVNTDVFSIYKDGIKKVLEKDKLDNKALKQSVSTRRYYL